MINPRFIEWNHAYLAGAGGVSGDGTHSQGRERGDDEGGTHFDGVLLSSLSRKLLGWRCYGDAEVERRNESHGEQSERRRDIN